jgi:RNA polymerase sigma factor (sigma-70 family)
MIRIGRRERSDRALARAIAERGDEHAFRELYRRHTPRLYAFVLRVIGGDDADAEDVVQETWLRAVAGLSAFRWESQFGTWLTGIGFNRARDHLRRRGVRLEVPVHDGLAAGVARRASPELRIDLERAIEALPPGYRAVLLLHDVEGFTHQEIGEQLGIAPGTSKSQLSGARRTLRALLGEDQVTKQAGTK